MEHNPSFQIRILVADDHGIVRGGLRAILDGHFHVDVVGTAANVFARWVLGHPKTPLCGTALS
jgi:DNA-binding NarL/FixJ family response regulator